MKRVCQNRHILLFMMEMPSNVPMLQCSYLKSAKNQLIQFFTKRLDIVNIFQNIISI